MSSDQRAVMRKYGGSRDSNNDTALCHTAAYDARGYHSEMWWFCDSRGSYEKGYTFTNGVLTSVYSP